MPQVDVKIIFKPTEEKSYNTTLNFTTDESQALNIIITASSIDESLNKSLRPFKKFLLPQYIHNQYPLYVSFLDEILKYLEEKNSLSWYDNDYQEKANSIYHNIENFEKFGSIEDFPIINRDLMYAFLKQYAASLSGETYNIQLQDDENMRTLIQYANVLFRFKGTYKSYDFYMKLIKDHIIFNENKEVIFNHYFTNSFDATNPPEFTTIDDDEIVLTDVPCYYVDGDGDIQKNSITNDDKGKYTFQYQIVGKADIIDEGEFIRNIRDNFHPAGFQLDILKEPIENIINTDVETKIFQKIELTVDTQNP